jgi:hypothetical protein
MLCKPQPRAKGARTHAATPGASGELQRIAALLLLLAALLLLATSSALPALRLACTRLRRAALLALGLGRLLLLHQAAHTRTRAHPTFHHFTSDN